MATCWMAFDLSRPCQARYGLKPEDRWLRLFFVASGAESFLVKRQEIRQVNEELSTVWKARPSSLWSIFFLSATG